MPVEVKPLFRPDVLRPRLNSFVLPSDAVSQLPTLEKWAALLASSQAGSLKEDELLPDFLSDIFLRLLGYSRVTDSPESYSFSREHHVEVDGKFADAVLGRFARDTRRYVVAIEGKGPTDPLDRPFKSRKMSAVDQGYRYAINLPCDWIIVTSISETRLFFKGADQYTFERFRISDLAANPATLKRFVYLLGAERVLPPVGPCHLDELRATSDRFDKELTKSFYVHYADIREDSFDRLCVANPSTPKHAVLTATQKALDRVLFCAFCEDRGLLPTDTIAGAFEHRDPYNPRPIWENFRGLFRSIDAGNEALRIPAYNGGLFAHDSVLDAIAVPDDVCMHFRDLGAYSYRPPQEDVDDAESEGRRIIDVDILGHIFEQSIGDLEQIRNELDGLVDQQTTDKHKSRRKKEGAFYTPAFITRYIIEQTLGAVLKDRFESLRVAHQNVAKGAAKAALNDPSLYDVGAIKKPARDALKSFWEAWQEELATLRILDPACGSGAFLIEAFDQLHAVYQLSNDRLEELRGHRTLFDLDRQILQNNLYGVDLNEEAIDICRLSLWIKTAQRGKQLTSLDHTIRVGNSVVDDPAVHPAAFDWASSFPEVTSAGGFDVVVGNPPYIRQEWIRPFKPHWQASFKTFASTADIYVYFYEQGLRLLRPEGRMSYIVTNKWLKADYGEPLRRYLVQHGWLESVVDFGHAKQIFPDADVFPSIVVVKKPAAEERPKSVHVCSIPRDELQVQQLSDQIKSAGFEMPVSNLSPSGWALEKSDVSQLMQKIAGTGKPLKEFAGVGPIYGIKTGLNAAFLIDTATRDRLVREHSSAQDIIRPYLRGQDIKRWGVEWAGLWMILAHRGIAIEEYPSVLRHLESFREQLEPKPKSHQGEKWAGRASGQYRWFELQSSLDNREAFEKPKIVYQEIQFHPWYALDSSGMFTNNKCFIIPSADLYLLAVLNSPLMWWHNFRHLPHMKDEALTPVGFLMEELPIAEPSATTRQSIESRVEKLNEIARQNADLTKDVLSWLYAEFGISAPGTRLSKPSMLSADEFVAEVKKRLGKGQKLSVAAVKQLNEEYLRTIVPARDRLSAMVGLEKEVSDLVNEVYGLSAEEIALMWSTAPPRMPFVV